MPRRLALTSFVFLLPISFAAADAALPKVPDGFQVELVLQAPAIEAPTALCVAPNGDVYFAEDPMDMRGPPTKNIDKIWLLKGGDPAKKVLFADNMWAVMGLEIVRDKLYVVHAPHVTVFTLDKDGSAAKREELFTDLGPPVAGVPSFNDHIPSGIRMGMDGWLYVSIGDKGIPRMTRKETDQGSVHVAEGRWRHSKEGRYISLEGGGVIRFRPDGSGLEVFASGTRNHLDVPMDEHDRIFVRDNTDDGLGWWTRLMYLPRGAFMGYPWAYTKHPDETLPMIRDFGGGAPCGGWVYCDDGLPETYRGRVFHCEWGQGKVFAVKLATDGAGFKFVDQITFMDPGRKVKEFRPFTLRPTADGRGFYVTDWGYGGWLDKRKAGRLWKVTYTKGDVQPAPRGKDTDSIEQLIKSLDHPAHSERLRAQRELAARGTPAARVLIDSIKHGKLTAGLRHAVWTVQQCNSPLEEWGRLARELSESKDEGVRLEAVRAMASNPSWMLDGQMLVIADGVGFCQLSNLVEKDPSPQVRLQAAMGLFVATWDQPFKWLQQESDASVRYTFVRNLREVDAWRRIKDSLPNDAAGAGAPRALEAICWAATEQYDVSAVGVLCKLRASKDAGLRRQATESLARVYKDRKPYAGTWWGTQPAGRKPPPRDVAWAGTPVVRAAIVGALKDTDASVRKAAVMALAAMKDPNTLDPIVQQLATEKDLDTRKDLVRAVGGLGSPQAVAFLAGIAGDGKCDEGLRVEAIAGLAKADTEASIDALVKATAPTEPIAMQVRSLQALGTMRAGSLKTAATAALKSLEADVRKAAVDALAARGGIEGSLLVPFLTDSSADVRSATARALGALKDRAAVPALVQAAGEDESQFDAITALTKMPDRRALTAYLTGLASKNVELRKSSAAALTAIRMEALPDLEQLVRRNEVSADLLPELRLVYSSFSPVLEWKLIGPFADDGKAHPPETEQRFDATYRSFDKDVGWKAKKANAKNHGFVDLEHEFTPNTDVVAYGYAEVPSDIARYASIQIGSDDSIAVWLNGKKVHEYKGERGWAYDQMKTQVFLAKGTNRLLVRCGNRSGPWGYSVAFSGDANRYAFLRGGTQKYDIDAFRSFGRKNSGDADRGQKLFRDVKGLACIKCHAVGGDGGRVGPDLAGIAVKYKREDLMTSVLEPSKTIAQGYETIVLTLKSGKTMTGVFKGESADAINLADTEGKEHSVAKKDVEERFFSPISTMPNGLSDGMTLQDFADLIAFLEARREERTEPRK
jgi:putative membrane-bound dehydrogenase-like protein